MRYYGSSHVGLKRKINEDSWLICSNEAGYILLVVADGMGGHNAGDIASKMAVSELKKDFLQTNKSTNYKIFLKEKLRKINVKIYKDSIINAQRMGMGTTIVVAIINEYTKETIVAHAGDSRAYYIDDLLHQITDDHSVVNDLVRSKELTETEARVSPLRNIITSSLGVNREFKIEMATFTLERDGQLLLCSDGLIDYISTEELRHILKKDCSIEVKGEELLQKALDNGGGDNITIILADNRRLNV